MYEPALREDTTPMSELQMRGVRVFPVLRPEDLRQAIKTAGVSIKPREEDLLAAAAAASKYAWDVVVTQLEPSIPTLRRQAGELDAIAQAADRLRDLMTEWLDPPRPGATDLRGELIRQLSESQEPLFLNLLSYIGQEAGAEHGAALLADRICQSEELSGWCQTARDAVMAGVERERRSRRSPEMRSRLRELGWILVASYVSLTGKKPGVSRKAGANGQLGGPLIRFLRYLVTCIRQNLANAPETRELAKGREWRPSDEALRSWVTLFRTRLTDLKARSPK